MKKTSAFTFLLLAAIQIYGQDQSYEVGFPLYSNPGRFYSLDLKKDHSYTHELFNSYGDGITVLDSGTYSIAGEKMTFHSLKKGDNTFGGKTYFFKVSKEKNYPLNSSGYGPNYLRGLIKPGRKKILILSDKPID